MAHYVRLFLALAVLLSLTSCAKNLSFTFEIPKEEIQAKVQTKFPLKPGAGEKEKSPVELTISDPVILLEEGKNQIGIRVNVLAVPSAPQLNAPKPPSAPADGPKPPGGGPKLPGGGPGGPPGGPGGRLKDGPSLPGGGPQKPPAPPQPKFTGTVTVFTTVSYDPKTKSIHLSNPKITNLDIKQLPPPLEDPLKQMAEKKLAEKLAEQSIPLEGKSPIEETAITFMKSVSVKNGKLLVEIGW